MRHFTCVQDLGDLKQALNEAFEIKKDRFQFSELGKNKTWSVRIYLRYGKSWI